MTPEERQSDRSRVGLCFIDALNNTSPVASAGARRAMVVNVRVRMTTLL